MPKTISTSNPHLQEAVKRLERTQKTTGWVLIGYGVLAQWVALTTTPLHPVAGLPFIAAGFFTLLWGDPALLALAAVLFAFACVPSLNPALSLPGPDPIVQMTGLDGWELAIVVGVKAVLAFNAIQNFLLFRMLYGTRSASSADPTLDIIPPMVPNRTDRLARWARSTGLVTVVIAGLGIAFVLVEPQALTTRVAAEMAGGLGLMAAGLGLGAAFSPTDERPAALLGLGAGLAGYMAAAFTLFWLS